MPWVAGRAESTMNVPDFSGAFLRPPSAAFPALSFLLGHTRGYDPLNARTKDIEIVPDFAGEGIDIYLIAELTLFPILIVGNALSAVIRFVVAQIKITSKYKSKKNDKRKV